MLLSGQLDGKPWSQPLPGGPRNLSLHQYARVEGMIPAQELATFVEQDAQPFVSSVIVEES